MKAERKLKVNLKVLLKLNNILDKENLEIMEPNSEKKKNKMTKTMISWLLEIQRLEQRKQKLPILIVTKRRTQEEEEVVSEDLESLEEVKEAEEVDFSRIHLKELSE